MAITIYATLAELANIGAAGTAVAEMDVGKQDDAVKRASGLIDGYLRKAGYTLPLTAQGGELTEKAVSIAVYWLMSNEGYNPAANGDSPIERRYLDALKWLEGVAAGRILPDVTDSSQNSTPVERAPMVITSSQRGFSTRGVTGLGCGRGDKWWGGGPGSSEGGGGPFTGD